VLKALHDAYGVQYGVLNTIHAYTMGQGLLDSPNKSVRRGRAAAMNLVPTSTGAAKAVGLVIPELLGKLDGLAIRTPNADGSLADLTLTLDADPSIDEVHETLRAHAAHFPNVLEVSTEELVSTDIIGNSHSSIVDTKMTMKMGPMLKLLCWYDNEAGYATRLVDVGVYLNTR
jgi:glyceraldehyde 3-phosphate dehydrogenase